MTVSDGPTPSVGRWAELAGAGRGEAYARRFERLAASGQDVHGEASCCARLVPPGARVLDAGCGTGRVAVRLAALGYRCVGVDVDPAMLEQARLSAPDLDWIEADLATFDPGARRFDLVIAAGNVLPFVADGAQPAVIANLAAALDDGALLVTGAGLDAAHLPRGVRPYGLDEYDAACRAAGLRLVDRFATWDGAPYQDGGYAVSVHRG